MVNVWSTNVGLSTSSSAMPEVQYEKPCETNAAELRRTPSRANCRNLCHTLVANAWAEFPMRNRQSRFRAAAIPSTTWKTHAGRVLVSQARYFKSVACVNRAKPDPCGVGFGNFHLEGTKASIGWEARLVSVSSCDKLRIELHGSYVTTISIWRVWPVSQVRKLQMMFSFPFLDAMFFDDCKKYVHTCECVYVHIRV